MSFKDHPHSRGPAKDGASRSDRPDGERSERRGGDRPRGGPSFGARDERAPRREGGFGGDRPRFGGGEREQRSFGGGDRPQREARSFGGGGDRPRFEDRGDRGGFGGAPRREAKPLGGRDERGGFGGERRKTFSRDR